MNRLRLTPLVVLITTLCGYHTSLGLKPNSPVKILSGNLNERITLHCGGPQSVHILDASYGNPSVDHFLIKKSPSDAPHTLPVVQMLCEGKPSCDIPVNDETFKILSLIKDFHKLVVKYTCTSEALEEFPTYNVKARRGGDNTWDVQFEAEAAKEDLYLHVEDVNALCEKPLLRKKYIDVNEAEKECNSLSNCVFIIFNSDGYTLCESSSYTNATVQRNSKIYVKMSYISGRLPHNYEVFPNVQGVCEKKDVVFEMNSALRLEELYEKCREVDCDYFTMSTANGVKGLPKSFRNYAWFCKGFPKYVSHEGFIFGKNNKRGE
ncbi:hypothetical protein PVIIG_05089 [Plasmodium vivax India VII]|uniref:SUEL-type lectin domain-containing protein n=4 Tax=Plasmodium vivax TaxID=5855 RepID=A5K2W8_PLAVS|nr:hypothetical protein, conserved [Plasmodium vivax]EDL45872.1 hypothetical protein, conserved [Plasmodium vivax]KMZ79112.1 hypothetical protein PVIIG_05089 [Plasmodium vivax India VII]KMZ91406.1 hypothetical protein PVMG_00280 [Plasmodium vivax Mauritania I]KMZ98260.1 hypothetical protein PVNG_04870 [Plasmodium vivax North Korean]|eukprot:XP_001615599.1 hypothetical protein [Plasmodium vivax Sal-1]